MKQRIIITSQLESELAQAISECNYDRLFVLTDDTTRQVCWPLIANYVGMKQAQIISIGATDTHKDLDTLTHVWKLLGDGGGTRHSCLINLGGGMVTDLGGFAASTFKRGIDFINIPTTLLAMVDASVGGKTGINFNGLKNEIGVFNDSKYVLMDTRFLATLNTDNLNSGYAEMLKHGLIDCDNTWSELLRFDIHQPDLHQLSHMVADSVKVKERIVAEDPHEQGLRKALNFGHTFGHAFESWALKRSPILHGYAVAYGIVAELYLSCVLMNFPTDKMRQTINYIRQHYGSIDISCNDYDELITLMRHDKKNTSGTINFTLLSDIGHIHIDQTADENTIKEALDFYRETL